jgi:hypothetical protein
VHLLDLEPARLEVGAPAEGDVLAPASIFQT